LAPPVDIAACDAPHMLSLMRPLQLCSAALVECDPVTSERAMKAARAKGFVVPFMRPPCVVGPILAERGKGESYA
jgi:hypothetical protein